MLTDRTFMVTGAADGIGSACTRRLLGQGNRVLAVDLDRGALEGRHGGETDALRFVAGDVADAETAETAGAAAVAAFGGLDGLAHFAARHSTLDWEQADAEEFNRILSVNVTGSFLMAKAAARVMIDRGVRGAIVLTASGGVLMGGTGGQGRGGPAYTTSKGGVLVLVRCLARSWGRHGIRVNALSPGVVETAMTAGYSPEAKRDAAARAALGRIAQPDEPAAAAAWLLSDDAGFVTGENLSVNGGAAFG